MKPDICRLILKSLIYHRKDAVYQIIIVLILSAIIAGSLFTGHSVRSSLKRTSAGKLGNTDIIINSGLRYFDPSLAEKTSAHTGNPSVSIIETEGYCSNFSSGLTALNVRIYGIDEKFFPFQGSGSLFISPGEAGINNSLARHLDIAEGEEIIVRFRETDPLPANAPFAPARDDHGSRVMKVSRIIPPEDAGDFSPGVSQQIPMVLFLNINDLAPGAGKKVQANRILIDQLNRADYNEILSVVLTPDDIGLTLRTSPKTAEKELVSDRIFLDRLMVSDILERVPEGDAVLTYLVNSFRINEKSTPYSFVTALPENLYPGIGAGEIIINRWLAEDIDAVPGDTVTLSWYDPSSGKSLEEKSKDFYISAIAGNDDLYADPSLMPDFPGISGSTTCAGWDAGVPILLDKIRKKDEDYWNLYRGTPKAFISYETGEMLWGNNFGNATAIRFPATLSPDEIRERLRGNLDPATAGFAVVNARDSAGEGAAQSVDFSSLFLSLSFFMIISCLILLSLAVSMYFDTRRNQTGIMYALGFRNKYLKKLLFSETLLLSAAGAIPGVFLGYLLNLLIIRALNTVWSGAVHTTALSADFSIIPLVYGFLSVLIISAVLIFIKTGKFLEHLTRPAGGELKKHSPSKNLFVFSAVLIIFIILLISGFTAPDYYTILFFASGTFLFAALVLLIRFFYIRDSAGSDIDLPPGKTLQKKYYSFHPSHIVTPVVFIAAGIFAVMITGANKLILTDKMLERPGGTGGYLLWAESAVPVKEDLAGVSGKMEYDLDEEELKDMFIVQCSRVSGDDASCLNLNYVASPPLLGVDPEEFIKKKAFSFASGIKLHEETSPWELLGNNPGDNTIYGIADQTVLQWGLQVRTGDTLVFRSENGQPLNIIIGAGLKSSVFQGYLLISRENLSLYYPSVEGSSVFLVDGRQESSGLYRNTLNQRLSGYGFSAISAGEKLASFFRVTNTYLNVFAVFGAFGMILGITGLGFVLLRNYNIRKREFAFLSATGYTIAGIRRLILRDQLIILAWGVTSGAASGIIATLPSIRSGSEMPWSLIIIMILVVIVTGTAVLAISVRRVKSSELIFRLRKE